MNPGECPLEDEIIHVGYLITSQWKPKEMSQTTCDPQMHEDCKECASCPCVALELIVSGSERRWNV